MKVNQSYTIFPKYYDEVMSEVPYQDWVGYLESLLHILNYQPKTVLDLACGTGNVSFLLAELGYRVIGIDGSVGMVEVARKKAVKQGVEIEFTVGDFRNFVVEEEVDLVVSLYDSLNYLLTETDLAVTFRQVFQALKSEGYFIFDLNTIFRLTTIEEGNSMVEGDGYYFFWRDILDSTGPYWKVHLTLFEEQEDGHFNREDEEHIERGYPIKLVTDLLVKAGFRVEHVYDAYSFDPGDENSDRIYFVARKVKDQ